MKQDKTQKRHMLKRHDGHKKLNNLIRTITVGNVIRTVTGEIPQLQQNNATVTTARQSYSSPYVYGQTLPLQLNYCYIASKQRATLAFTIITAHSQGAVK